MTLACICRTERVGTCIEINGPRRVSKSGRTWPKCYYLRKQHRLFLKSNTLQSAQSRQIACYIVPEMWTKAIFWCGAQHRSINSWKICMQYAYLANLHVRSVRLSQENGMNLQLAQATSPHRPQPVLKKIFKQRAQRGIPTASKYDTHHWWLQSCQMCSVIHLSMEASNASRL